MDSDDEEAVAAAAALICPREFQEKKKNMDQIMDR
jgi:hypothetical protein